MHVQWGDVPTWLAVIVASFGGGVALWQLRDQQKVIKGEIERNKARDALLDGQLRELQERADSARREQAEAIDVTWNDAESLPGKSVVTVINGSRRPIRNITCWLYPDDGVRHIINDYGVEMLPALSPGGIDAYSLPAAPEFPDQYVAALRARGRAGFQMPRSKTDCDFGSGVAVRFTDDAKRRWELTDGLSLKEIERTIPLEELGLGMDEPDMPSAEAVPS